MFKDEVYEEMDDISKLIEPIESQINNELSKFPERIEITFEDFRKEASSWGLGSINAYSLISKKAAELNLNALSTCSATLANGFFKFEAEDLEGDTHISIDYEKGVISHKVFLVKTKLAYDDAELEKIIKQDIIGYITRSLNHNKLVNKSRLNELADLYGAKDVKSCRGYRDKVIKFTKRLEEMINNKTLDIRDVELSKRFSGWVVKWVSYGNLGALNNLTKIKIITHENRPIYSIEEKEC